MNCLLTKYGSYMYQAILLQELTIAINNLAGVPFTPYIKEIF
jgi:hypothetical protein